MGFEFTAQELTDIDAAFSTILGILNAKGNINLTNEERQSAKSISYKRQPFVSKVFEDLAVSFPNLRPSFSDYSEAQKDYTYGAQTSKLLGTMMKAMEVLEEHSLSAENLAFQYVLDFYNTAKRAAERNVPGSNTAVDALSPLFEQANNVAQQPAQE